MEFCRLPHLKYFPKGTKNANLPFIPLSFRLYTNAIRKLNKRFAEPIKKFDHYMIVNKTAEIADLRTDFDHMNYSDANVTFSAKLFQCVFLTDTW
jgi:hypothetical protein